MQEPATRLTADLTDYNHKVRRSVEVESSQKELSLRFPLQANREDRRVDLVGAGGSNPVRAGARRPSRSARGIFEGERPSTSRM